MANEFNPALLPTLPQGPQMSMDPVWLNRLADLQVARALQNRASPGARLIEGNQGLLGGPNPNRRPARFGLPGLPGERNVVDMRQLALGDAPQPPGLPPPPPSEFDKLSASLGAERDARNVSAAGLAGGEMDVYKSISGTAEKRGKMLEDMAKQRFSLMKQREQEQSDFISEYQKNDQKWRSYADDQLNILRESIAEASKEEVDPGAFFKKGGGAFGVLSFIAGALGSVADHLRERSGRQRIGNKAWELIQQAVERDIQQQVGRIQQKERKVRGDATLYDIILQKTNDQRQAALGLYSLRMEQFSSRLGELSAAMEQQEASLAAQDLADQAKLAAIQAQMKYLQAGTQKPLSPDFVQKQVDTTKAISSAYELAGQVAEALAKGESFNVFTTSRIAGMMGWEQADVMDKMKSMFRRLGRADGVDVGNLSEKEGDILVRAGTGSQFDMGPEALRTLVKVADMARMGQINAAQGLRNYNDISGLVPTLKMTDDAYKAFVKRIGQ